MQIISRVLLLGLAVISAGSLLTAASITYQISNAGVDPSGAALFRYTYTIADLTLQARQEVDIRFNPAVFGKLSNGVASLGFDLMLLQPNNPPGAFGDYSLFALVNNPSLAGPFRVDFTLAGSAQPGSQPYLINQYDVNGNFVGTIGSGVTTSPVSGVPEPATLGLTCFAFLVSGSLLRMRGNSR